MVVAHSFDVPGDLRPLFGNDPRDRSNYDFGALLDLPAFENVARGYFDRAFWG